MKRFRRLVQGGRGELIEKTTEVQGLADENRALIRQLLTKPSLSFPPSRASASAAAASSVSTSASSATCPLGDEVRLTDTSRPIFIPKDSSAPVGSAAYKTESFQSMIQMYHDTAEFVNREVYDPLSTGIRDVARDIRSSAIVRDSRAADEWLENNLVVQRHLSEVASYFKDKIATTGRSAINFLAKMIAPPEIVQSSSTSAAAVADVERAREEARRAADAAVESLEREADPSLASERDEEIDEESALAIKFVNSFARQRASVDSFGDFQVIQTFLVSNLERIGKTSTRRLLPVDQRVASVFFKTPPSDADSVVKRNDFGRLLKDRTCFDDTFYATFSSSMYFPVINMLRFSIRERGERNKRKIFPQGTIDFTDVLHREECDAIVRSIFENDRIDSISVSCTHLREEKNTVFIEIRFYDREATRSIFTSVPRSTLHENLGRAVDRVFPFEFVVDRMEEEVSPDDRHPFRSFVFQVNRDDICANQSTHVLLQTVKAQVRAGLVPTRKTQDIIRVYDGDFDFSRACESQLFLEMFTVVDRQLQRMGVMEDWKRVEIESPVPRTIQIIADALVLEPSPLSFLEAGAMKALIKKSVTEAQASYLINEPLVSYKLVRRKLTREELEHLEMVSTNDFWVLEVKSSVPASFTYWYPPEHPASIVILRSVIRDFLAASCAERQIVSFQRSLKLFKKR